MDGDNYFVGDVVDSNVVDGCSVDNHSFVVNGSVDVDGSVVCKFMVNL